MAAAIIRTWSVMVALAAVTGGFLTQQSVAPNPLDTIAGGVLMGAVASVPLFLLACAVHAVIWAWSPEK